MHGPVRRWASVLENKTVATDTRWMQLHCPDIAAAVRPGQFVMVGTGLGDLAPPLLPRPFSVAGRSPDGRIGLLLNHNEFPLIAVS